MTLNIPLKDNKKLAEVLARVNKNIELNTYIKCSNIMAVDRMNLNDHGPVHIAIVSNIALKLLRNLEKAGIEPSLLKDHPDKGFTQHDAEVLVLLAAALHDVGHIVTREDHHIYSLPIARDLMKSLLEGLYDDEQKYIIISDVLHAIYSHHKDSDVETIEGGIIRISDALDMEEGRAMIPFKAGSISIHAVSAMAIDDVRINYTQAKPISIEIVMNNSAGIFQIDYLLKSKITGSRLEKYVEVKASTTGKTEKRIIDSVKLF